tara:strand:+ start:567 stop:695 length:129 start_codon:yes stop_codon:yes gene_type:complete
MNTTLISIMTLGIAITGISAWWVSITIKEGNKALEESKKLYK